VLVTDIVGSTKRAASVGDARWRELLDEHDRIVRAAVKARGGRVVNTTGDGFVATFVSPTNAIECALAVVDAGREADLELRAGLHAGEVEARGRDVGGIGVHIAARISARALASEVLVSDTVRDLVAGSEIPFSARGTQTLKGVPGRRRVYAVGIAAPAPTRPARTRTAASPPAHPIRLLVADDHPLWRDTLRGLLEHGGAASVVAEASTGEEAVAGQRSSAVDVVLMDIDMPVMNGIEATQAITDADPAARVLVLSSLKERREVVAALRAGAHGYLLKTASRAEVIDAVRRVHGGELVFPADLSAIVLAELREPASRTSPASRPTALATLTERELDVLRVVAEGASNIGIARRLHLSSKTIEAHIAAIFMKLGLEPSADQHRRVQAAVTFLTETRTEG
jgi:DNA-binding NarL/FixJ family response regulator